MNGAERDLGTVDAARDGDSRDNAPSPSPPGRVIYPVG